ncbi:MAG: TIGR00730 family Rossman fold protein [Acutalibacteraceae bacterium]|nr:TIGR00730 family Rossman fold protein [Acutalibacteraceae bacterium]
MNLLFYGASSASIDKKYLDRTENLAYKFAQKGCNLVFGAGGHGNMGAAARGFYKAKAKIIGVVPRFFNVDGILFDNCDELIRTDTMRERKQIMEDRCDAFITTPGGIGTYEEFFEILTLKQLGRHNKAMVLYNVDGYYDNIIKMMKTSVEQKFMRETVFDLFLVSDNDEEIIDYILNYDDKVGSIQDYKFI